MDSISNGEATTPKLSTKATLIIIFCVVAIFGLVFSLAATEDYSEGERIGFVTKFSHKGRFWKSWEGELNLTQTGMNTSSLFNFSVDNDQESEQIVSIIDSAVNRGWKVKVTYHQTLMKNWFKNRGETSYFVKSVEVVDRNTPVNTMHSGEDRTKGRIIDTVYLVIDKRDIGK